MLCQSFRLWLLLAGLLIAGHYPIPAMASTGLPAEPIRVYPGLFTTLDYLSISALSLAFLSLLLSFERIRQWLKLPQPRRQQRQAVNALVMTALRSLSWISGFYGALWLLLRKWQPSLVLHTWYDSPQGGIVSDLPALLPSLALTIVLSLVVAALGYGFACKRAGRPLCPIPGDGTIKPPNRSAAILRWFSFSFGTYGAIALSTSAVLQYAPRWLPITYSLALAVFCLMPVWPLVALLKLRWQLHRRKVREEVYSFAQAATVFGLLALLMIFMELATQPQLIAEWVYQPEKVAIAAATFSLMLSLYGLFPGPGHRKKRKKRKRRKKRRSASVSVNVDANF